MNSITRRGFFAGMGAIGALTAIPSPATEDGVRSLEWPGGEVESTSFRLSLSPRDGLKNTRLLHPLSGLILADAHYSYSFERPTFQVAQISKSADGSVSIDLQGSTWGGSLEIVQKFRLPHDKPWIEEEIALANRGSVPLDLSHERCGFVLPLTVEAAKVSGQWKEFKLTAVPYRREPRGNKSQCSRPKGSTLPARKLSRRAECLVDPASIAREDR